MRVLLAAALAAILPLSATADQTEGVILAFDRQASILVMADKTVWELPADLAVPSDLAAGDRVKLDYDTAGEDGLTAITGLERLATAEPEATGGN